MIFFKETTLYNYFKDKYDKDLSDICLGILV